MSKNEFQDSHSFIQFSPVQFPQQKEYQNLQPMPGLTIINHPRERKERKERIIPSLSEHMQEKIARKSKMAKAKARQQRCRTHLLEMKESYWALKDLDRETDEWVCGMARWELLYKEEEYLLHFTWGRGMAWAVRSGGHLGL